MSDPLNTPKTSDVGPVERFKLKFGESLRKRVTKEEANQITTPAPGVFDKPSTAVIGVLKLGEDFQKIFGAEIFSTAEAAGVKDPELKVQDFEFKALLKKYVGGPVGEGVTRIGTSKLGTKDELEPVRKIVTADGRTIFYRPGDLDRLKLVNDQRARDGRPPLPSPFDPVISSTDSPTPGRPIVKPKKPKLPPRADPDPVIAARPNDKQPEPPGRPLLVRFLDP